MEKSELLEFLTEEDVAFLEAKKWPFTAQLEGDAADKKIASVILDEFALPDAYAPQTVRLMVRIPKGYPETSLDMFFTRPWVKLRTTNSDPKNCSGKLQAIGEEWQQWSRHTAAANWRSNVDRLETYFAAIKTELEKRI